MKDIDPEILEIADIILDYGIPSFHYYNVALTGINFDTFEVQRFGVAYDLIRDCLKRHFDVDLPEDPGRQINPLGHTNEFGLEDLNAAT